MHGIEILGIFFQQQKKKVLHICEEDQNLREEKYNPKVINQGCRMRDHVRRHITSLIPRFAQV